MIRCPKCDADNQIGAIFCRGCGEKLDLDELKPSTVRNAAQQQAGSNRNWFAIIKNIIMGAILLALLAVLGGLFLEPGGPEITELTQKQKTDAYDKVRAYWEGKVTQVTLNNDEINHVAKKLLALTPEEIEKTREDYLSQGQSGMMTTDMKVELLDDNRIKLIMTQQRLQQDWFKYHSVIILQVDAKETGGIDIMSVESSAQGKVPMNLLPFTSDIISTRMLTTYRGKQMLNEIVPSIVNIKITEGKMVFNGKRKGGRSSAPAKKNGKKRSSRRRR